MMDEADQIAALTRALSIEARRNAEKPAALVSATFDWLAFPAENETVSTDVEITRATRTLVFARATMRGADGRVLMAASAVHRC